jgi:hypothetical protein
MSGRFTYQSSFETVGESASPDIVYYNASIVNNNTDDIGTAIGAGYDPPIRFNETRDTAIVKDASKYQFSIIRFVMNGANKDLPLFIPAIQSSTGQTNVNLTEYGVGITWEGLIGTTQVNIAPPLTYIQYVSETQNPALAPLPRSMANPNYVPTFQTPLANPPVDLGWVSTKTYYTDQIVYYTPTGIYYRANTNTLNQNPSLNPTFIPTTVPPTTTPQPVWSVVPPELGQSQDLTSRYYWVYTYSHWVDLVNTTLNSANNAVFTAWTTAGGTGIANFPAWKAVYPTPIMKYNENSGLFTIYYPTQYVNPNATTNAFQSLYFNVNMEGLFANFDNIYLNSANHPPNTSQFRYTWITPTTPIATLFPDGYANLQIVEAIGLNDNVSTPTIQPTAGYSGVWYAMTQNYVSTSTLWSPIDSIVFTSTLLPLQNEQTAPPNALGSRNTGNSTATSQSAFSPIITDVSLDLSTDPTAYRKMIYYAPSAEYRMADFQNSKQDIRNIDIQVFWKNRLDNQLYPVSMFNLSSVSFKLMFRKKTYLSKNEKSGY